MSMIKQFYRKRRNAKGNHCMSLISRRLNEMSFENNEKVRGRSLQYISDLGNDGGP